MACSAAATRVTAPPSEVSDGVQHISTEDEYHALVASAEAEDRVICIKVHASFCRACKAFAPRFTRLTNDPEFEHVEFYDILIDENKRLVEQLGLTALPAVEIVAGGRGKGQPLLVGKSKVSGLVDALRDTDSRPGVPSLYS